MKKSVVFLTIIIVVGLALTISAQENKELKDISNRVKLLEDHKDNLDERFRIKMDELNTKVDLKTKELTFDASNNRNILNNDFNMFRSKVDGENGKFNIFIWIFGPTSLIAILLGLYSTYKKVTQITEKKVLEIAEKKAGEQLERIFNENTGKLVKLIEDHDHELNLKKNKSILVISPEEADDRFLRYFFPKMGFVNVEYIRYGQQINYNGKDVIMFNNEANEDDKEWVKEAAPKSDSNSICFYYGKGHVTGLPEDIYKRFASTNIKSQLYGNLINALKYQKVL